MSKGAIPYGTIDDRSIEDVRSDDVMGHRQCHFFAGIGGWAEALRLAGIPKEAPLWTGSCPCQPLSSAGEQKGHEDERHLWPSFFGLIAQCRPAICFGEQVGGRMGQEWLAAVRADLEGIGYAVGAADLPATGVGAWHERRRLYWFALDSSSKGWDRHLSQWSAPECNQETFSVIGNTLAGEWGALDEYSHRVLFGDGIPLSWINVVYEDSATP